LREYTYEEFTKDVSYIASKIDKDAPILAVARGGVTLGHFLSNYLDIRDLFFIRAISYDGEQRREEIYIDKIPNLQKYHKITIVDDISDTGRTLQYIVKILKDIYPTIKITTATIFVREESSYTPDVYCHTTNEWVKFFWEF
jgi:xanthine phosphoribosyltransferase